MGPEGSLPHSQVPVTWSCPEPDWSGPRPQPTSWRFIFILSSDLRLRLPSGLFPSGFPIKTLYIPLFSPYVLYAPPISSFSICSPERYWVKKTNHQDPHDVEFSTPVTSSLLGPNILLSTIFSNRKLSYTLKMMTPASWNVGYFLPYYTASRTVIVTAI